MIFSSPTVAGALGMRGRVRGCRLSTVAWVLPWLKNHRQNIDRIITKWDCWNEKNSTKPISFNTPINQLVLQTCTKQITHISKTNYMISHIQYFHQKIWKWCSNIYHAIFTFDYKFEWLVLVQVVSTLPKQMMATRNGNSPSSSNNINSHKWTTKSYHGS